MELHEKEYLLTIQDKLKELIIWHVSIIIGLRQKAAITTDDVAELESITNLHTRTYRLIEIMKTKVNGYTNLTEVLQDAGQSGATELLTKLPKPPISQPAATESSGLPTGTSSSALSQATSSYKLIFNEPDMKNVVLPKVRSDLISIMENKESNTTIILNMAALTCFDRAEIDTVLLTKEYSTQQARMTDLFARIGSLDQEEIVACLEQLCNLKDLPNVSKRFRKIFDKHYPDCVKWM